MRSSLSIPLLLALAVLASGCAGSTAERPVACAGETWTATHLFLGRNIPTGGEVSDRAWRDFVDAEVATRFPDGFTVLDGTGVWRDTETRETQREANKVLVIFHPGAAADEAAVAEVSQAYIARFDQQAVLRADRPSCVRFYEGKSGAGS